MASEEEVLICLLTGRFWDPSPWVTLEWVWSKISSMPVLTMKVNVPAEDAPEIAQLLDAKRESMGQIIEEEQAHMTQVAALSQMQLQAMKRVEAPRKGVTDSILCWWSTR